MTGGSKIIKGEGMDGELSLDARLKLHDPPRAAVGGEGRKVISPEALAASGEASRIVAEAKAEGEAIRARARDLLAQVEDKVRSAREEGYKLGREEGLASVTETLARLRSDNEKLMGRLEREALELVFEIGRKVLGEAFRATEEALLGMIRQALGAAMGDAFTVLLNPRDYERLKESRSKLLTALHGSQVLQMKPAEAVRPGTCVIESELGTVEADLESQLKAIRSALGLGEEPGGGGA